MCELMEKLFGLVKVNGLELAVQDADCSLFVGRLNLDSATTGGDLAISNVPFTSAVRFDEISGKRYSCADCTKGVYENSIFKPAVYFRNDSFAIISIDIASGSCSNGFIEFTIDVWGIDYENNGTISVSGKICAACYPIDAQQLLYGLSGPIPIRFAEYYLPIIGLPGIAEGTTLSGVIKIFGQPNHRGGGLHAQYGSISNWIRYTLTNCYLHLQFIDDLVTQVTIISLNDPPCDLRRTMG